MTEEDWEDFNTHHKRDPLEPWPSRFNTINKRPVKRPRDYHQDVIYPRKLSILRSTPKLQSLRIDVTDRPIWCYSNHDGSESSYATDTDFFSRMLATYLMNGVPRRIELLTKVVEKNGTIGVAWVDIQNKVAVHVMACKEGLLDQPSNR